MTRQLDRDLIEHARHQLGAIAHRLLHEGMGPESAARAAIRETRTLFPHGWHLGVQGSDDDEFVEVWEVEHKYPQPIMRLSRAPRTVVSATLTPDQQQHLAIIQNHGGRVRRSFFGGWLDGVRGLRLPMIKQLERDGLLATEKTVILRRTARSKALPTTITTYRIV